MNEDDAAAPPTENKKDVALPQSQPPPSAPSGLVEEPSEGTQQAN